MTYNSILKVTNGTQKGTVNLLDLNLIDWTPLLSPWKSGGIWQSSPFSDGSRLVNRNFDLTQDSFTLAPNGQNQDTVIEKVNLLIELLEQAVSYWTTVWQNSPVWIEARGEQETNIRYATIHAYSIPELDNPYATPFAAAELVALENFTLIIAHLLWMSQKPGQSECVVANNKSNWYQYVVPTDPTIIETADSAVYRQERDAAVIYSAPAKIGYYAAAGLNATWYTALRFRNVQCERGAYVPAANADLEVCSAATYTPATSTLLRISALRGKAFPLNPGYTEQDYLAMPRLSTLLTATIAGAWTNNTYYDLHAAMGGLLTEIFAQDTWDQGDDIILFIECDKTATTSQRTFQLTTNFPRINIDGILDTDFLVGQCDGCEMLPVANKQNKANIDYIRKSNNGVDTSGDFLPWIECDDPTSVNISVFDASASVSANAYMAFCCRSVSSGITVPGAGIFNSLVFYVTYELGGGGTWVGKWQYWNGAWVDLPYVVDTSNGFQKAGLHTVVWTPPVDWTTTTLVETGWWVRYLVTSVPVANSVGPKLIYFDPYTITTPYITIEDENAKGDVAALAKTIAKDLQTSLILSPPGHSYNDLYMAVRSLSRGTEFAAYLNCSDEQNPNGITCTVDISCAIVDTPALMTYCTPTDRTVQWSPAVAATPDNRVYFTFNDVIAKQYHGVFAAFVRYYIDGGGNTDFTGRLITSFGGVVQTTDTVIFNKLECYAYLGNITIGGGLAPDEYTDIQIIGIQVGNTAVAGWGDIYLVDLILLPLDEFTVHIETGDVVYLPETPGINAVVADSIGYPKSNLRAYMYDATTNLIERFAPHYSNKGWMQQPSAQRIWFWGLYGWDLPIMIRHTASFRYLGMRGKS